MYHKLFVVTIVMFSSVVLADPPAKLKQLPTPAERIKALEIENQRLRETIKQLKAQLAANANVAGDMIRAAEVTRTDINRADEAMLQMLQDNTLCKVSQAGPGFEITMNRAKWESLTKEQKEQFLTAVANWGKTRVPTLLQSRVRVLIIADDLFKALAEYKDGKVKFIN